MMDCYACNLTRSALDLPAWLWDLSWLASCLGKTGWSVMPCWELA
jgi:hypothetical protein